MDVIKDLTGIVGKKYVSGDREILAGYETDLSLVKGSLAEAVVRPGTTEEVSRIVKWANEKNMPVIPVSSAVHLYGSTIPKQGGVVIDMQRFNEIFEIDLVNRFVRFGAGVTWKQLIDTLAEKGMRVIMPLTPRHNRSVVTDHLEREVTTNMVYDYGEPTQSMEVVFPNGDIFRTGSASVQGYPKSGARGGNPSGPGIDFYRLLQCAQGTMGIVTWMSLKIQSIPKIDKIKFAQIDSIENLNYTIDFLYRILPRRIGQECLILNNTDLAAMLAENKDEFESLKNSLPKYTLVLVISGLIRRPEEKIQYEENFLEQIVRHEFQKIKLTDNLPGFPGVSVKLMPLLRGAWHQERPHWKNSVKGGCQDLFFITRPEKASEFVKIMETVAGEMNYPFNDIGCYIQPIEHNRACQVQFSFFYDDKSEGSRKIVEGIFDEAFKRMHENGGYFTRPYGNMAKELYDGAASYTVALKKVKNVFDPNNILNPGNLCF